MRCPVEIYDEDDDDDFEFSEDSITLQEDGSFFIRGDAELDDVDTILALGLYEDEALKEFATLSGFLCMCAGEIPRPGDFIMTRGWCFEVLNADDKKILLVRVERLVGTFVDDNMAGGGGNNNNGDNPIRKMLRLAQNNNNNKQTEFINDRDEGVDDQSQVTNDGVVAVGDPVNDSVDEYHTFTNDNSSSSSNNGGDDNNNNPGSVPATGMMESTSTPTSEDSIDEMMQVFNQHNKQEALEVERMVESSERKRELLEAIRREQQEQ